MVPIPGLPTRVKHKYFDLKAYAGERERKAKRR